MYAFSKSKLLNHITYTVAIAALLGGCAASERLDHLGKAPSFSEVENTRGVNSYQPVKIPMPKKEVVKHSPNSLWQSGSRAFFKDQRAAKIGDILTVEVAFSDEAQFDNSTERSRAASDNVGIGTVPLVGPTLQNIPGASETNLIDSQSAASHSGSGSIRREESLTTNIAAIVTQILPNGNMVIEGRQEVRVNYEIRELIITGLVRPEDIDAENTISSTKIAQARLSYGGRGQISDMQQPRYGPQLFDTISPL